MTDHDWSNATVKPRASKKATAKKAAKKAPKKRPAARPVKVPAYFMRALRKNTPALATFTAFPPSHKREYSQWISEAKGEDTRQRRVKTAIEWIAEGKGRNWKYEKR